MGGRRKGGREGGRVTLNSLGSGWFRFRDWFVFALVGWMVCERLLFGLSGWFGLVWSGWSGWLYSCLGEELLLVLFCSVCLLVRFVLYAVCCMLHAVLVLSCLCAFDVNYRQQLDDPDRATRLSTFACLIKVS